MTVRYVDPTAAIDGSGTSSSPWKTFYGKAMVVGDSVWIRRAGFVPIPNNYTFPTEVGFFGWPKGGDDLAWGNSGSSIPPGAPAGWAADTNDYAEIRGAAGVKLTIAPMLNVPAGSGNTLLTYFRIKFNQPNTIASGDTWVTISAAGGLISDCLFVGSTDDSVSYVVQCFQGTDATFRNCKFEVLDGHGSALIIYPDAFGTGTGPSLLFDRCAFTEDAAHFDGALVVVLLYDSTKVGFCGCSFIGLGDGTLLACGRTTFGDTLGFEELVALNDCTFDDTGRVSTVFGDCVVATKLVGSNVQVNTKTGVTIGTPSSGGNISSSPSWLRFSKFTQTAPRPWALKVQGATSRILVENFSPHASTVAPIIADQGARVELANAAAPSLRGQNVFVKDEGGVIDAWHRIALQGDIHKSAVHRTGGASFSAKFTFDQDANAKRPLIYGEPGDELISRFVQAGGRTLTLYGAYKGYTTALLPRDVWFEVEYFDGPATKHRALASSRNSAILVDSSTWTGDSGLTFFKVQVSFTQQQNKTCPIRIYFRHYDAGAVTYVDPQIEVA